MLYTGVSLVEFRLRFLDFERNYYQRTSEETTMRTMTQLKG